MALAVTHSTVATLPDEPGAEVNKAEWNAAHTITGAGTMAEQAASAVAITGGTAILTSLQTPTINGGTAANDDITIQGTTHATRTSSFVLLQPTDGNVGIGTTTPGTVNGNTFSTVSMHNKGPASNYSLIDGSGASEYTGFLLNRGGASANNRLWAIDTQPTDSNTSSNLCFSTYTDAGSASAKLTVLRGGDVGVGTITPGVKLDVVGTIRSSTRFDMPSFTVATLPAAGAAGGEIYVSDAAVAPCLAFSNGTNWKRCDNAATTVV